MVTALLGTLLSSRWYTPEQTAFRSRLPKEALGPLSRGARAFPVKSLPYFADKVTSHCTVFQRMTDSIIIITAQLV